MHGSSLTVTASSSGLHDLPTRIPVPRSQFSNATHFRKSSRFALERLRRVARRTGALIAVRESSAQHFQNNLFACERGDPTEEKASNAHDGMLTRAIRTAHEIARVRRAAPTESFGMPEDYGWPENASTTGFFEFVNRSRVLCHTEGVRTDVSDWHNDILREEATATLPTADGGPESVAVVPWHAHTAIWGAIFPPADSGSGDCTHTYCYTPYYFAPLWDGWATALRAQVEAGSTATAEPATHRGRHESDMEHQHAHEPERGGRGHQNNEKNPLEEATFLQSFARFATEAGL